MDSLYYSSTLRSCTSARSRGMWDRETTMPIYMKYEGIFGPVTTEPYKGWIELTSTQLSFKKSAATSEIVVTKVTDSSSTQLFNEALRGEGKKVSIDFVSNDGVAYLRLELEKTVIVNYSSSSS